MQISKKNGDRSMKKIRKITGSLMMFFCSMFFVQAQTLSPSNSYIFNATYNRYWQSDTTVFLEIETAFYPSCITFVKDSTGYEGKTELQVLIQRKSDSTYVHAGRFSIPVHIQDSADAQLSKSFVNKLTYVLNPGAYKISIHGIDEGAPARRSSSVFEIEISGKPKTTAFSDVELCSNISESSDTKDDFYKNGYRAIPNPGLVFGSTAYPVVFSYVELYNLESGKTYSITVNVVDEKGKVVKQQDRVRQYSVRNTLDITTCNIAALVSGKYKYQVVLSDAAGKKIASAEKELFIYNPNVKTAAVEPSAISASEFAAMSEKELREEFRHAQYIAGNEEKAFFNKLTNAEGLRAFLAQFWRDMEAGKNGTKIMRVVYLKRVTDANQRYRSYGQEGWHTDRGRVYIVYGEPDEVERVPSTSESKPYETWRYNQMEGGVEFDFVDRTGFGEYVLQNSTKLGEIKDDNWQQSLH
jgi:GWxTD domain-containing protein